MVDINRVLHSAGDWFERVGKQLQVSVRPYPSGTAREELRGAIIDAFVIDASGSMAASDFPPSRHDAAVEAAGRNIDLLASAQPGALVTAITFATRASLIAPPRRAGESAEELKKAIRSTKLGCTTNLGAGLDLAGRQIALVPEARRPRVIILTDGHSNCGPDPERIARNLKEQGVQIDAIGIGGSPSDVNEAQLRRIVSTVDGESRYWFIRNAGDLVRKFESLALREV